MYDNESTICAIATPAGQGAIAVIRISGKNTFNLCQKIIQFSKKSKKLIDQKASTIHRVHIIDNEIVIDDVLIFIFKNPSSYTGEDLIEISCHGSIYIQQHILELLIKHGARLAESGEFTYRAFRNGKVDLTQAEAIADLIDSYSESSHLLAMKQMRGGFSSILYLFRDSLLHFISLIELELDFSEEEVEFADRKDLKKLINEIIEKIVSLEESFYYGNAIKKGVPVAIVGKPNVGKSTLLNVLLNDEKAIVSETPGTTRDIIEDSIIYNGIQFRFIDTAGIHQATNQIEKIGIEKAYENIKKSLLILLLIDPNENPNSIIKQHIDFLKLIHKPQKLFLIINKIDQLDKSTLKKIKENKDLKSLNIIFISAKKNINIQYLINSMVDIILKTKPQEIEVVLNNVRHYDALFSANEAGKRVIEGLEKKIPTDLIAQDIREILYYIGSITGEITTDEILGSIFKNFCIGK